MPTVLVTGANRGIGHEFARQFAVDGWKVLAACRHPEQATELARLGPTVEVLTFDVTDEGAIAAAAGRDDAPIDLLLNVAGIIGQRDDGPGGVDYAEWARLLDTNVMGPVRVLDAFAGRLARSERKLAVAITSGMGSLADAGSGGAMMYRTSKAALNMAMRARSFALRPQAITVVVINPGWVQTDMGGPSATKPVAESVAAMRRVLETVTPEQSGSFLNYDGKPYPW